MDDKRLASESRNEVERECLRIAICRAVVLGVFILDNTSDSF